jgi:hypothetical protein
MGKWIRVGSDIWEVLGSAWVYVSLCGCQILVPPSNISIQKIPEIPKGLPKKTHLHFVYGIGLI